MAAEPTTLSDTRTMRAGTGIGIALAIAVTVGAIAFVAPKLREEMREDIFSAPGSPAATAARPAVAPAPQRTVAAAPASTVVPAPDVPLAPLALKPATAIVPAGSLGPGESEIAPAPAAPPARNVHAAKAKPAKRVEASRKKPVAPTRTAQSSERTREASGAFGSRPVRAPLPAYRERSAEPRRDARGEGRLVGGIRREDPLDYRTWRPHRNTDAPPTSPVERQPG